MSEAAASPVEAERVLIFGGTFDPPHIAHVELPQLAARELGCQRIVYIPAATNPLKTSGDAPPPTPAKHRLEMLKLALRKVPNATISTIELDRPPPSYTIETLRALQPSNWASPTANEDTAKAPAKTTASGAAPPSAFLLIGADQALDFHRWKDWQEILRLATPAVMLRPPWTSASYRRALRERYGEDEACRWEGWTLKTLPMMDVSATAVRRRLREGDEVAGTVPPEVERYMHEKGVYDGRGTNDRQQPT